MLSGINAWAQHLPPFPLYLVIFAWLFIESTGFPISDEPLLLLAGYLAHIHRIDLALSIGVALVGKVTASFCAYWVGRHIDLMALARPPVRPTTGLGHWLYLVRPTSSVLLATEQRFRRQGVWGVFLGRLVPVVRSFISYPAGAAQMPAGIFLAATSAGSLIWIVTWMLLGMAAGRSFDVVLARWGRLSWIVLVAFLLALGALWLWGHRRAARAAHARDQVETK
jgi:membrane protein DedA with SNARE-associated domain